MKKSIEMQMAQAAKRLVSAAVLGGVLGFVGATQATPVTVDLDFSVGGLFPAGSKNTHIAYDNGNFSSGSMHVAAGMFGGTASNGVNFDETTLYLSENNVLAYCIDILNGLLRNSSTYNVNNVSQSMVIDPAGVRRDLGRTLQFLGAANQVAGLSFGDKNWLNPSTNWMSAAIQVGIWESLYEESSVQLDTTDGWFTATSIGSQGNQFLADSFALMAVATPPAAVNADQVKWLQIDGGQDLLVDPIGVPAPAPLALLLSGLALVLRRKR